MKLIFMVLFLTVLTACTDKSTVRKTVYHGMFDGLNQVHEMQNPDSKLPVEEEQPTYEQYKKDREELLKDQKNKGRAFIQ